VTLLRLAACILWILAAEGAPAALPPFSWSGDLAADGVVDGTDIHLLADYLAGNRSDIPVGLLAADLDGRGAPDLVDGALLATWLTPAGPCFYVAPGGNDAGPGSLEQPWGTIQKAMNALAPGQTALVRGGTYAEKLTLNVNGSASAGRVTIRNFGAEEVVVDGAGLPGPDLLNITNRSHVTIQGLRFRNSSAGDTPTGIRIEGSGTGLTIRNCAVTGVSSTDNAHGLCVYGTSGTTPVQYLLIEGNEIYGCQLGQSESLTLNGNVRNFRVCNNRVHDNDNIGIVFIGFEDVAPADDQAREGVCRGNLAYHITTAVNPTYTDLSAGGIYVDGGRDIVVENNTCHHCDIGLEVGNEHTNRVTSGITVRNNLLFANKIAGIAFGGYDTDRGWVTGCQFLNNTLHGNDTEGSGTGEWMIQKAHDNVLRQNITSTGSANIAATNYFSAAYSYNNSLDWNLWYGPGGADARTWVWQDSEHTGFTTYRAATGQDPHSLFGLPSFATPAGQDFHLQAGSPAIDAGDPAFLPAAGEVDLDGRARLSGSRVDLGADETAGARR